MSVAVESMMRNSNGMLAGVAGGTHATLPDLTGVAGATSITAWLHADAPAEATQAVGEHWMPVFRRAAPADELIAEFLSQRASSSTWRWPWGRNA